MARFRQFCEDLSARSRRRKMEILHSLVELGPSTRILDVGGQVDPNGRQILDTHPYRENVTVVNLDAVHLEAIEAKYPEVTALEGDATSLPFEDKSFDLVYSNAVIEHVPSWPGQRAMAREIQRTGKAWFLTTPNKWFPFEFHARLPFISWLPTPIMMAVQQVCTYNHCEHRYRCGLRSDTIRLLTRRRLRELFPDSLVIPVRITLWPETIVVAGPRAAFQP